MTAVGKLTLEARLDTNKTDELSSLSALLGTTSYFSGDNIDHPTKGSFVNAVTAELSSYPNSQMPRSILIVDNSWFESDKSGNNLGNRPQTLQDYISRRESSIRFSSSSDKATSTQVQFEKFTQYNFDDSLWRYHDKKSSKPILSLNSSSDSKNSKVLHSSPNVKDVTIFEIDKAFLTSDRTSNSDFLIQPEDVVKLQNALLYDENIEIPKRRYTRADKVALVTSDVGTLSLNNDPKDEQLVFTNYTLKDEGKVRSTRLIRARRNFNPIPVTTSTRPVRKRSLSETKKEDHIAEKKKRVGPRSRIGCWTCRIRHKACDESKPDCAQCERLHLKCDYSDDRPQYMSDRTLQKEKLQEIRLITDVQKKINFVKKRSGKRHQV